MSPKPSRSRDAWMFLPPWEQSLCVGPSFHPVMIRKLRSSSCLVSSGWCYPRLCECWLMFTPLGRSSENIDHIEFSHFSLATFYTIEQGPHPLCPATPAQIGLWQDPEGSRVQWRYLAIREVDMVNPRRTYF